MKLDVFYTIDIQGSGATMFISQLQTSVFSIRENKRPEDDIEIHVLYAHIPAELMHSLLKLNTEHFIVSFFKIQDSLLNKLQSFTKNPPNSVVRTYNGIVFARLWIPYLFPKVEKCLYLDTDTLILTSLHELYEMDIGEKFFGIAMGPTFEYGYNSGVLIVNVKEITKHKDFYRDMEEYMSKNVRKFALPDQTLINRYFSDKLFEIPEKWNFPPSPPSEGRQISEMKDASILHFIYINSKPVQFNMIDYARIEWNDYLSKFNSLK